MCKTFNVVPLPLTRPIRINLSQENNFTVKSVKGVFCCDSLIACRCNCCLINTCNSTFWQHNYTTVTLSWLKKNKLNKTSKTWESISLSHSPPTNCTSSFFENRERNLLKLSIAAAQSFHLVGEPHQSLSWYLCQHALRWTNVFVTSNIWCDRRTYSLFCCKVANVYIWMPQMHHRISN